MKIFVATPAKGRPGPDTYNTWAYNLWQLGLYGIEIAPPKTYGEYPLSHARNEIAKDLLDSDCTHLFTWDIDQTFYVDTLKRLIDMDVAVASGWYLARNPEKVGTVVVFRRKNYEGLCDIKNFSFYKPISAKEIVSTKENIMRVDGIGLGCALIRREVFENMEYPYHLEWSPYMPEEVHKFGEDLWFCDRLHQMGTPIYINKQCFVGHELTTILGDKVLLDVLKFNV